MGIMAWFGPYVPTLFRPALLLTLAVYHFVITVLTIATLELRPWKLLNLNEVRLRSFARLWNKNGAEMSTDMPGNIAQLLSQCRGLVLDIGPGSGEQLHRFNFNNITAMYGAEPAADLHPGLRARAYETGFGHKYHALVCGGQPASLIPALHKANILSSSGTGGTAENGVFDEICCVRVLCGVPHPKETIQTLYTLLKPGGRMVVCEHVRNPWRKEGRIISRLAQLVYTFMGWPFFMGGCEMQRRTKEYLQDAGRWSAVDLQYVEAKTAIPFVVGELIKVNDP